MKKLAAISSGIGYLLTTAFVYAQGQTTNQIQIVQPGVGYSNISDFINAALRLAFIIGLIVVLIMLVWGAIQWIFSGGTKEAVGSARDRIINALIGLAILAVAFAIVSLAGQFVGINLLGNFIVPSPTQPTPPIPR